MPGDTPQAPSNFRTVPYWPPGPGHLPGTSATAQRQQAHERLHAPLSTRRVRRRRLAPHCGRRPRHPYPGTAAVGHEKARCHASQPDEPPSRGAQALTRQTAMTCQIPIAGHAASSTEHQGRCNQRSTRYFALRLNRRPLLRPRPGQPTAPHPVIACGPKRAELEDQRCRPTLFLDGADRGWNSSEAASTDGAAVR